jgi:hypothetical protein
MTTHVSNDPQTQAIPRVPAAGVALTDPQVAALGRDGKLCAAGPDTETAALGPAPEPDAEIAGEKSVEHLYTTGLAKLEALHDRWAVAMAEIRKAPASDDPAEAAA